MFALLALLFIKHFVADFLLQTPHMYQNKGTYGHRGGIDHALVHYMLTFAVLTIYYPLEFVVVMSTVDFMVHYHMDWFKVYWCIKNGYGFKHNEYWIWLGIDQLVHALTYIAIVYMSKILV